MAFGLIQFISHHNQFSHLMRQSRPRGTARLQRIIIAGIDFTLEVDQRTKKLLNWPILKKKLHAEAPALKQIAFMRFHSIFNGSVDPSTPSDSIPVITADSIEVEKGSDMTGSFDEKESTDNSSELSFRDPFWWDKVDNSLTPWDFDLLPR
jgi:hypothetical protein